MPDSSIIYLTLLMAIANDRAYDAMSFIERKTYVVAYTYLILFLGAQFCFHAILVVTWFTTQANVFSWHILVF